MRSDIHRFLVAYDISDDRRRVALANVLSSYGDRVQYSVFIVDAPPFKLARLRRVAERIIKPNTDSILICDLGPMQGVENARFTYLGRQRRISSGDDFVV